MWTRRSACLGTSIFEQAVTAEPDVHSDHRNHDSDEPRTRQVLMLGGGYAVATHLGIADAAFHATAVSQGSNRAAQIAQLQPRIPLRTWYWRKPGIAAYVLPTVKLHEHHGCTLVTHYPVAAMIVGWLAFAAAA